MPSAQATSQESSDTLGSGSSGLDDAIAAQQVRLLYSQTPTAAATSTAVAMAIAGFFWSDVPGAQLPIWLGAMFLVSAWRIYLLRRFRQQQPLDTELAAWQRLYLASATASGLMFGGAWWMIAPHSEFHEHLLLAFALGGMMLGSVPLLGSVPRIHGAYTSCVSLPCTAWMSIQGTPNYVAMTVLSVCFFAAVIATGRTYHRALLKMMTLAAMNRQLREHQIRLRDFADMGADLFWESDRQGRFTYLSEGYEKLTGINPAQMLSEALDCDRGPCFVPPEQFHGANRTLAEHPFSDHALKWEPEGTTSTVLLSSAIPIHTSDGVFLGLRGTVRDITQQHRLAQKLSYQASHDSLTDLANRREFEQRLKSLLQRTRESALSQDPQTQALCYLDLDQFKLINDTCGHAAGDALLKQLAGVLRQRLRTQDTLARLGGDEFGVLIEHCGGDDALVVAEGMRNTIEAMRFQWDGTTFNITASIGVVGIDAACASAAEIMMAADAACYAAKDGGRNRVHVFKAKDEVLSKRHGEMQWVTRITRALEEDRLTIAAQPIVNLQGRRSQLPGNAMEHFEVLLRMRDDDQELIAPNAFLPAAERYNLASRLDLWVVNRTMDWLLAVPGRLQQVHTCCINLSGHSISDEAFLEHLRTRFKAHPGIGERICFELTETAAMANLDKANAFIRRLRRFGCRFALDDFGTGLSSFGYLKSLPVDYLKIDGVFVRGMVEDEVNRAMVKAIFEVARIMDKKTVAEHVEDDATLAMLRDLGVDHAQGHGVATPRSLDDLVPPPASNVVNLRRQKL